MFAKDVFICHASEDKESAARPLVRALVTRGLEVWFDEYELRIGDSLTKKIDAGLRSSRYGIVILSKQFFGKKWTERELAGLVALETGDDPKILPVWHGVTAMDIRRYSPTLADRMAISTDRGIDAVADSIVERVGKLMPDRNSLVAEPAHQSSPSEEVGLSEILGLPDSTSRFDEWMGYARMAGGDEISLNLLVDYGRSSSRFESREKFEIATALNVHLDIEPTFSDPPLMPRDYAEFHFKSTPDGRNIQLRVWREGMVSIHVLHKWREIPWDWLLAESYTLLLCAQYSQLCKPFIAEPQSIRYALTLANIADVDVTTSGLVLPLVPKGEEVRVGRTRIVSVQDDGVIRHNTDLWGFARDFVKHALTETGNAMFEGRIDDLSAPQFESTYFQRSKQRPFQRPVGTTAAAARTITIELPFQHVANRDAVFAVATIESQGRRDRVSVLISGPSQVGFTDMKQTGPMPPSEIEEARAWFALIELAHRPAKDLEQVSPPMLPEIRVSIPTGPGYRGGCTIEAVRSFAAEQLRGWQVTRERSFWRAALGSHDNGHTQRTSSVPHIRRDEFLHLIGIADRRFDELRSKSQDEIAKRHFGRWVIAHQLVPAPQGAISLRSLPEILRKAKGSEVGWPIGVVQSRPDAAPAPWNDGLEAWVISRVMHPSLDYWYAEPTGFFYQTRAFEEDLEIAGGTQLFDVTLPIWRMGEAILHAWRMAKAYGTSPQYSRFFARYEGLSGRTLWSHRPEIDVLGKYTARIDSWSNEIKVPADGDLSVETLADLTHEVLDKLYEKFGLFEVPRKTYLVELRRMMEKAV